MTDFIANRISKDLGMPNLVEVLAERMLPSDMYSVLLAVVKQRISTLTPARVLQLANAATVASDIDSRLMNKIEALCYDAASGFEAIELSPLAPLGAVSCLTGLDASNLLSTIKPLECAADPTIGLALESARRRRQASVRQQTLRLCSSHRVTRFPIPETPGFSAHFKLFCMITAGRNTGSYQFELSSLLEHIDKYLSFLSRVPELGFGISTVSVEISDTRIVSYLCALYGVDRDQIRATVRARDSESARSLLEKYDIKWPEKIFSPSTDLDQYNLPKPLASQMSLLEKQVIEPLRDRFPGVEAYFSVRRLTGLGYYDGPCFHIKVTNDRGETFMLSDGGSVGWTQLMLGDQKERLMTSAIGIELFCRMFGRAAVCTPDLPAPQTEAVMKQLHVSDAAVFWQLRLRALKEEPDSFGGSYEESVQMPLAEVEKRLSGDNDAFVLGAYLEDKLVGTVGMFREQGIKARHKGVIWGMYVAPEARGRHIARALLCTAIQRARAVPGLDFLLLSVVTTKKNAHRLYQSLGFVDYGRQPAALKVDGIHLDEFMMALRLTSS